MKESLSLNDRISLAEYRRETALERLKAAEVLLREGFYNDAVSNYHLH